MLLPIGIQDFEDIRKRKFCYVDKTARIHKLINGEGKAFFISRPRRFGKSLLCSTIGTIFEGNQDLFKESAKNPALAINSLEWKWKKHPVIYIDLNPGNYWKDGIIELNANLNRNLKFCAQKYGIPLEGETPTDKFAQLINDLHKHCGEQTVVIIDEYDKPLLDTIDKPQIHEEIRNALRGFYGVLKSSDSHLRFVFLTGVTKFSKVSIFSDLNHLVDLTLNKDYADICGLTEEEVIQNFKPKIETALENTGMNYDDYLKKLRMYYNGYRFSKNPLKVYNPYGLLNHFRESEFLPYWYETGTPAFLIKLIAKQKINILDLSNMHVGNDDFRKYDIENMRAEPILYQSGYLTISDYDTESQIYTLDYPNEEVRSCFAKSLMEHYLKNTDEFTDNLSIRLIQALLKGDTDEAEKVLRRFLAAIPYDIIKESENYYEVVIYLIFKMLGFNCKAEVRIAAGRIDTLVETKNFVYCFEFKLDKTAEEALKQIDTKDYLLPWEGSGKTLFKIGVSFDSKIRNIGDWKCVAVEK